MVERNTSIALYDPARGEWLWMACVHTSVSEDLTEQVLAEIENLPAAER